MASIADVAVSAGTIVELDDSAIARETIRRASVRLLPFLFILFVFNFLDRTNVAIAALQMNRDLHFSAAAYGFGAGVFFIGYSLFEVPSNLILARVGARLWIARIMISWGVIASAMMFVRTPGHFYLVRGLLGFAEAGFFPGIVYYLSEWFPQTQRARAIARFMIAIPLSQAIGAPISGWLLGFDGHLGLHGWQWLFLIEGIPLVLLGFAVLTYLPDRVEAANWLSDEQRAWLVERLRRDQEAPATVSIREPLRALANPVVWMVSLPWFLLLTTAYSFDFWAPIAIRDALHTSNGVTALLFGAIGALTAVSTILSGIISDRNEERFLHAAASTVVIAIGFLGAALLPHPWGPLAALTVVGLGQRAFYPPFWCIPTMILRGSAAAAGIALVNSIGSVGGFVGPFAVGLLKDATGGMTGAFLALAVVSLCAGGILLVLRRQAAFATSGLA